MNNEEKITSENGSYFKNVVNDHNQAGELKMQFSIDLTEYDTSTMEGYVPGSKVYKGYTCKLATLKPNKQYPRSRIDIDPMNKDIRKAIFDMYAKADQLPSK